MKPMLESRFLGNARVLAPSHRHGMMHAMPGRSVARVRAQSTAPVRISVQRETKPGERVVVLGNLDVLGNWDVGKAFRLKWTDGHVWCQTCEVPVDEEVEFKIVELKEDDGTMTWEGGGNRSFKVGMTRGRWE
ncbi:carbohydrate-binding-like protein [Dunaliella salina]|uniref:Carbohydrate-binding-like protein n=1 Tax=Dunaliella salina TaxID=3046 RepID=A0ABZ3KH89_DUNSA|nr:carbohydrate-binding-like protein [Dunaliella salina]|eukprot:KAF5828537.1 carbohydrate-binding-like protein [Dunaliella salina]